MTLEDVKKYLRVDGSDDDDTIQSCITAASLEIKRRSGKTKVITGADAEGLPIEANIDTDELYNMAVKVGVTDMYENRGSETVGGTVTKYSRTFNGMVEFISMCGDYV